MAFKLLGEVTDETAPVEATPPQKTTLETAKDFITAPLGKGPLAGFTEKVPAAPLGMAMPPAAGLLGRSLLQGGASGAEALMAGKGPLETAKEAGKGAAFNVGAEKVVGPLLGLIGRQAGATGAKAAYEGEQATRAVKIAHDKAMTGALNATEQTAFQTAAGAHANTGAAKIAQDLIDRVPALKGTEASGKGLYDAIYGSGKGKVSTAFDEALKDVMTKGKGQIVQLPEDIATRMGLSNQGAGVAGLPANVQALFNRGAKKAGMQTAGTPGSLGVDAAELAQKMTGLWKKDPQAYRAAANVLDAANIGNPDARGAYKAYVGISDFLDKAKALDANGNLSPNNILKALADLKKVGVIQRRGLGSGTEGAIQEAARSGPLKPMPREIPNAPPEPTPPDIRSLKNPLAGHPWIAGMGAEAAAKAIGHHGFGLPFLAGAGLSNILPKEIVTKGPISDQMQRFIQAFPSLLGVLAHGTVKST